METIFDRNQVRFPHTNLLNIILGDEITFRNGQPELNFAPRYSCESLDFQFVRGRQRKYMRLTADFKGVRDYQMQLSCDTYKFKCLPRFICNFERIIKTVAETSSENLVLQTADVLCIHRP